MKSLCILITLLIISFISFCQNTTYDFYEVYKKGGIEFIANKIKFRIHYIDTATCTLENFKNKWAIIDTFIVGYSHFYLGDINRDGFKDLVLSDKWEKEVYFFNPLKKNFIHTGTFSCTKDAMILLNATNSIYYDYQPYKRGKWFSFLFKIEDYKRVDLGAIFVDGKYSEEFDRFTDTDIIISKVNSNKVAVANPKPNPKKHFNYAAYWKLNWRLFMSK